jgi:lantibiotic modifying enzyme
MPIRLNLLAEAQAAEDLRRRDPVKRALWLAGLIIALMLAWSSFLQLRATLASSGVTRLEAQIGSRANEFRQVLDNQKKITEINEKLRSLQRLAANRFLNGTLLNALQQTTAEDVQLVRLKVEQFYTTVEDTRTRTNADNVIIQSKTAASTERIVVNLEGIDSSASPGDQVNRFKTVLATNTYFKDMLTRTNPISLKNLSSVQIAPDTGKPCVMFTLECRYPEKTR